MRSIRSENRSALLRVSGMSSYLQREHWVVVYRYTVPFYVDSCQWIASLKIPTRFVPLEGEE
jgi:hypothetical protein